MIRLLGIFKVAAVLALDFFTIYSLFESPIAAGVVTAIAALYVWLGGYAALLKERAVRADKLPEAMRCRLFAARDQLAEEVRQKSGANISRLKIYLTENDDMQATAYGCGCVSVSSSAFRNADPMTLCAVLGHEVSHTLHMDPEFSRAVLASIFLMCIAISTASFACIGIIFLLFLILGGLKSWIGLLLFRATTKGTKGLFGLMQKGLVLIYKAVSGCFSRAVEYRCDLYSAKLNPCYGIQLMHFLSFVQPESCRQLTLTEALYRSHPPTPKRIARIEAYLSENAGAGYAA